MCWINVGGFIEGGLVGMIRIGGDVCLVLHLVFLSFFFLFFSFEYIFFGFFSWLGQGPREIAGKRRGVAKRPVFIASFILGGRKG